MTGGWPAGRGTWRRAGKIAQQSHAFPATIGSGAVCRNGSMLRSWRAAAAAATFWKETLSGACKAGKRVYNKQTGFSLTDKQ